MRRWLIDLVSWQDRWSRPFGEFNHRWVSALFRPIRPVKDVLNGTWLGHPIHPAITDVPIGAFFVALVLDIVGQPDAALIALIVGQVTFFASVVTGLADFADADGTARARATTHGTIMVVAGLFTMVSVIGRLTLDMDPTVATVLLVLGLIILAAGAFVGGDLVFVIGNMVNRHAHRGAGVKWVALDTGTVNDLTDLAESTPTKMRAGINDLVVVRIGDTLHAMHAVCAHAGGPMDKGSVTPDGCLECPWHGSRFRLGDGSLRRGPSVYDQPSYEIRRADAGGYEVRRRSRTAA